MIQSVKFDSSNMDIKKIANITLSFIVKRLIEISGIVVSLLGILLFITLISYSPSDPNFIYTPESAEIENFGGFYGSTISDFLLQSLGLVSTLLIITIFIWGLKLTTKKKINNL